MSFGEHVIQLNDTREMPLLGLGVYKTTDDAELKQAIGDAFSSGYHLIDTASFYKRSRCGKSAEISGNTKRANLYYHKALEHCTAYR